MPELTFILDVDFVIACQGTNKRKDKTNNYTSFDLLKASYHEKIRSYFYKLSEFFPERIVIINANNSYEKVFKKVVEVLKEKKCSKVLVILTKINILK